MKLIIPFVFLFIVVNYNAKNEKVSNPDTVMIEKEMGLGLLQISLNKPISLYHNPKDSIAIDQINFIVDSLPGTKGSLMFVSKLKIAPYRMTSGDSDKEAEENINSGLVRFGPQLIFRVIEKTDTFFKVVTNENTFSIAYLKINSNYALYTELSQVYENNCSNCPGSNYNPNFYVYETWKNYFKRLEYITVSDLKLYNKPNGTLISMEKIDAFLPFQITELEGDWIKIKKATLYESRFDKSKKYIGWIRWKKGMDILVNIVEQTYE